MNKEFILAIEALEKEREISKDLLIEAIEMALLSAYKKNYGTAQNVRVNIDRETGDIDVYMRKDVVSEVEDEFAQVSIDDVIELDPNYQVGDAIEYRVTPMDFGRIAAQTAKQVVVQRIREAERGMIFDDYVSRQGEIITGTIQRVSNETVFVNMGRTEGILSTTEQVRGETYNVNSRMKFFIMDVRKSMKGPQIYLSRSHPGLVKRLFELEVPEIQDGAVEIKNLAREAGSRTKIAVYAVEDGIDPVGACVGARGSRVQAVVDELFGEKIDIINWSEEPQHNISSALSPAKVERVIINSDGKSATAVVPDYQLSLAIGKEGQNVRLAAKLCGWKIDIKSHTQYFPDNGEGTGEAGFDEAEDLDAAEGLDAVEGIEAAEGFDAAEGIDAEAAEGGEAAEGLEMTEGAEGGEAAEGLEMAEGAESEAAEGVEAEAGFDGADGLDEAEAAGGLEAAEAGDGEAADGIDAEAADGPEEADGLEAEAAEGLETADAEAADGPDEADGIDAEAVDGLETAEEPEAEAAEEEAGMAME